MLEVHWESLHDDHDGWRCVRCLYAYLAPDTSEILYIGKSWGVTVRQRWCRSGKTNFWDDLEAERGIMEHHALIGDIVLPERRRLTKELLADVESLLTWHLKPWGNIQNRHTRISRPGLTVKCRGDWPERRKLFRDE